MKSKSYLVFSVALLLLDLTLPVQALSQEEKTAHHHYKLVEVPTFGGPNFYANFTGHHNFLLSKQGTFIGGADTSLVDPYCFNSDCFVEHSFEWQNGVLTDLGALPGGANSQPFWINARGQIAGMSQTGAIDPLLGIQAVKAVVWEGGDIINLGTLQGGYESASQSMNNRGEVTGIALNTIPDPFAPICGNSCHFIATTQNRAFLWKAGEMRDLGTLGGPDAQGIFINDRGQIAGYSYVSFNPTSSGVPQIDPFLWEDGGKMIDLGSLGGTFGEPAALNNQGQVVGGMNVEGDLTSHAFLWEKGTLKDLGTFGGAFGFADDVNDSGEIVGAASLPDEAWRAFLWKEGVMTNLGTVKGDDCSIATAINSRGQIAGTSFSCAVGRAQNAALWENGSVIDLNSFVPSDSDLHLTGDDIYINDRGEIAGTAVLPNGDVRAFLLIPCDEGHPNIEGCDYSTVDGSAVAATLDAVAAPTATAQQKLTASEIQDRIRVMMTRNRPFGLRPQ